MSSILRALKKLENDPRHLEKTGPLDSKFVPLADTSPQKTSAGLLTMVIGGGIVCGLVVLAGWWLFSEKTQPSPVAPQNISRQSLQQTETTPALPKESATAGSAAVAVEPAKPAADIFVPQNTADQAPGPTPEIMAQPWPPSIEQREALPVNQQAAESALQVPAQMPAVPSPEIMAQPPAESTAPETASPPAAPTKAEEPEIPALHDPEVKLQAITWSKDPQKRIAVINNRILRQGEVVYGYRIDTINQDDVVLSEGGEKWKLLFRIN